MRSKHKIKEEINEQWPESARTVMLEKQEWYDHPHIYQYGFYDGYQHAVAESVGERAEIERKNKLIEQMRDALRKATNFVGLARARDELSSSHWVYDECIAALSAAERGE